jgi:hypothetical protein
LKGYGEGVEDPTAQALLNVRRNLGEAGRAVVGAKPYDETNPTGSYRAVQALMNAPTPAAIIPEAAQAAGKAATALSGLGALGVVKPKGGNWLAGSIERGLKPMKQKFAGDTIDPSNLIPVPNRPPEYPGMMYRSEDGGGIIVNPEQVSRLRALGEINNWIDTKLTKYIKNEMATPEDPVRALAERGVLHRAPYELADPNSAIMNKRLSSGMPVKPMGQSQEAQFWENVTDRAIDPARAADFKYGSLDESILQNNPWLEKVPDEAMVYSAKGLSNDLGFNHLIDELRNATNPDSGLPRSLQLSPEKLQKVTVPQAVELVDKINKWRAEQKVAADLKRSKNAATVEYKTYPQPNYFSAREPGSERFPGGFFTPDRAAAQKFGESFGKPVQGYVIEPRRTATEADVENVARRLGIYDEGVPADQYLTQGPEQIYDQAPQVVAELRNLGFDSARLNDGMSAQPSLVALDPSIVRPALDNPKGLRWVELALPSAQEDVSSMIIQNAGKYSILEPGQRLSWKDPASGRVLFDTPEKASAAYNRSRGVSALEESLKYEGETMGHCVGGYCPEVAEGRSRIYSLRDAKGEPHVTIEVEPGRLSGKTSLEDWAQTYEKTHGAGTSAEFLANHPEIAEAFVPTIKQIKGKANRAPKDEYLPFVQDFVRSGRWSDVGDLKNTGLAKLGNKYLTPEEVKPLVEQSMRYLEQSPALEYYRNVHREYDAHRRDPFSTRNRVLEAQAGLQVHPDIPYTYREMMSIFQDPEAYGPGSLGENIERVNRLRQLYGEEGYAAGGAVRMKDGGKPPKRRASDLPGYGEGSAADMLPAPLLEAARAIVGAGPSEPTNPSEVYRIAQTLANMSGVAPVLGGVVKGSGKLKSLGEMIDREVRKVRRMEELGKGSFDIRQLPSPTSAEVTGWHVTQDLPGVLQTGALTNRNVGANNLQGWAPAHVGGAYFYSHPSLAKAQLERVAEDMPEMVEHMPILRAQLRKGNRLVPDEDVGLRLPWQKSFEEGSFATTRPVMMNQIDRIYAEDPDLIKDIIRDTAVRQRRYKKGGAVTDPNEPEVKRLPEPGLLTATMYAETAAREMYPKDPVKRDAARHMIASSILGQKLSPGTSRLLGELYEFKTSPLLHLKSAVGLGAPPPGYEMDKFNNALGSEMQFRNQAELQRGVRQAVDTGRARLTPDEPAPYRRGGAVKIETNPTLMADELLFKGYRR